MYSTMQCIVVHYTEYDCNVVQSPPNPKDGSAVQCSAVYCSVLQISVVQSSSDHGVLLNEGEYCCVSIIYLSTEVDTAA